MPAAMLEASAEQIASASKSNLALALVTLPKERRRDMTIFYAFCRVIDDIADEAGKPACERRDALAAWRESLQSKCVGEPALAAAVREMTTRHGIDRSLLEEIINGCEMDLEPAKYPTWEALRVYCYRVASCVGLVSISIFGCDTSICRQYAIDLGIALQLTNILRDVSEDIANGHRIYLPAEDMARFGYAPGDLEKRLYNAPFVDLMRFEAARARAYYASAIVSRPPRQRKQLVAAELMRAIYGRILEKMERDGFRVFDRRYRVSKLGKLTLTANVILRTAMAGAS